MIVWLRFQSSIHAGASSFPEDAIVRQRLKLAGIIALILAAILLARLYSLQVSQYARYQTLSLDNHIRLQALSPVRGLILDRNGVVLAQNTAVYALKVTPERVPDMDLMLAEVGQIIDLSDHKSIEIGKFGNSIDEMLCQFNATDFSFLQSFAKCS